MAEEGRMMEDTLPAKRARFDFYHQIDESSKSSDNKYVSESEALTGGGGESTLTSDSGFNEFTPPQSVDDDDVPNEPSCSQSLTFESSEFEVRISREGELDRQNTTQEEDDDDACSVGSTTSNLSGLSNLSNISGKDWKPCAGPMSWVQQQMEKGVNPRSVLTQILGGSWQIPHGVSDLMLWHIIINMLSEPPKRERLRHINTIEDVIRLIKVCKKIIILTGAGVSVSCGIPDFRSKDGIYARLSVDFPDLPDPQAMFDINYFRRDPRPFFKFAKEIYPGQFTPSLCHRFIRLIEQNNKLLRNYTQNIDTLEQEAGISRVIQCHGSFATATCQKCSYKVDAEAIKCEVFAQHIPVCPLCTSDGGLNSLHFNGHSLPDSSTTNSSEDRLSCNGTFNNKVNKHVIPNPGSSGHRPHDINCAIKCPVPSSDPVMKPDIVFFGEGLPDEFHDKMAEDKDECDLLIVIGSSLKVRPVALIPSSIPPHVPQILINREPLNHLTFDVELLGDCDVIVSELCRRLGDGWNDLAPAAPPLTEIEELPPRSSETIESDGAKTVPTPSLDEAPHPKDESDIEALRACWAPKVKESMASRLPEESYLFCGGHRYVFPGAEVYYDPDDEEDDENDDDDDDDDQSKSSESEEEDDIVTEPGSLPNNSSEDTRMISSRRSSQALSEDVDSLLSTASCGESINNNTPDYPSESQWGGGVNLGGDLSSQNGSSAIIEDWTSLSASLGANSSSSNAQMEDVERHFDLRKDMIDKDNRREARGGQPTHCSV